MVAVIIIVIIIIIICNTLVFTFIRGHLHIRNQIHRNQPVISFGRVQKYELHKEVDIGT